MIDGCRMIMDPPQNPKQRAFNCSSIYECVIVIQQRNAPTRVRMHRSLIPEVRLLHTKPNSHNASNLKYTHANILTMQIRPTLNTPNPKYTQPQTQPIQHTTNRNWMYVGLGVAWVGGIMDWTYLGLDVLELGLLWSGCNLGCIRVWD